MNIKNDYTLCLDAFCLIILAYVKLTLVVQICTFWIYPNNIISIFSLLLIAHAHGHLQIQKF